MREKTEKSVEIVFEPFDDDFVERERKLRMNSDREKAKNDNSD